MTFIKKSTFQTAFQLPLFQLRGSVGGRVFSALALAAALLAGRVDAAETVTPQMHAAVQHYLAVQLEGEATRQGWQDMHFTHGSTLLNASGTSAPCPHELQVTTEGEAAPLQRQRLRLSCRDQPGWNATLLTQAEVFLPVLVARRVIDRGQQLKAEQLERKEANLATLSRGFFQRADQVTDQSAKRRIRDGQVLTSALLAPILMVRRGQQVKIVASQDGIQASTDGEALEDGQEHRIIRVRNLGSDKIIKAKVIEPGTVSSTF
jgi:flagella basal body P-ring formation protein FlgA